MDWDVVEARVSDTGCLRAKFADGLEGTFRFAPVNGYLATWSGDLDLEPDAMHNHIKECGEWPQ